MRSECTLKSILKNSVEGNNENHDINIFQTPPTKKNIYQLKKKSSPAIPIFKEKTTTTKKRVHFSPFVNKKKPTEKSVPRSRKSLKRKFRQELILANERAKLVEQQQQFTVRPPPAKKHKLNTLKPEVKKKGSKYQRKKRRSENALALCYATAHHRKNPFEIGQFGSFLWESVASKLPFSFHNRQSQEQSPQVENSRDEKDVEKSTNTQSNTDSKDLHFLRKSELKNDRDFEQANQQYLSTLFSSYDPSPVQENEEFMSSPIPKSEDSKRLNLRLKYSGFMDEYMKSYC